MIEFKKVFVDTAPFIYYLEQNPGYYETAKSFFKECYIEEREIITSVITISEYCIFPYRNHNDKLIHKFYTFIEDMDIAIINIDPAIAEQAAKIRAEYKSFRTMDSLQLATAKLQRCDLFLTNDKQLKQMQSLTCMVMDDFK